MEASDWPRLAQLWMRDPILRAETRAGQYALVGRAGFVLDEDDRAILARICAMADDDYVESAGRPWEWAVLDGAVCETIATFEVVLDAGGTPDQMGAWVEALGSNIKSKTGLFSSINDDYRAIALLRSTDPVPRLYRCTAAWRNFPAAYLYKRILLDQYIPTSTIPRPFPPNPTVVLWDLIYADQMDIMAERIGLKVVRAELQVELSDALFYRFGKELINVANLIRALDRYEGLTLLRVGPPIAPALTLEYHLVAAFDETKPIADALVAVNGAIAAWQAATPGAAAITVNPPKKWFIRANHPAGGLWY